MDHVRDPEGCCPCCGSWLEWTEVAIAYATGLDGVVRPHWEGRRPRCAVSARWGRTPCPPLDSPLAARSA